MISEVLHFAVESSESMQAEYAELSSLYERKLWHELTLKLEGFIQLETAPQLLKLADEFLPKFESKMKSGQHARLQACQTNSQ